MKKIILLLCAILIYRCGSRDSKINNLTIRDGFYEVIGLSKGSDHFDPILKNHLLISFDTLFNPGDFTKVIVDTNDFVPLELEEAPTVMQQRDTNKLLSILLSPKAAEKIKMFTARRIMKQVVIVMDGKAITMNKIRDTISGNKMQITRCGDNACEYLSLKMKEKVKK